MRIGFLVQWKLLRYRGWRDIHLLFAEQPRTQREAERDVALAFGAQPRSACARYKRPQLPRRIVGIVLMAQPPKRLRDARARRKTRRVDTCARVGAGRAQRARAPRKSR